MFEISKAVLTVDFSPINSLKDSELDIKHNRNLIDFGFIASLGGYISLAEGRYTIGDIIMIHWHILRATDPMPWQ